MELGDSKNVLYQYLTSIFSLGMLKEDRFSKDFIDDLTLNYSNRDDAIDFPSFLNEDGEFYGYPEGNLLLLFSSNLLKILREEKFVLSFGTMGGLDVIILVRIKLWSKLHKLNSF